PIRCANSGETKGPGRPARQTRHRNVAEGHEVGRMANVKGWKTEMERRAESRARKLEAAQQVKAVVEALPSGLAQRPLSALTFADCVAIFMALIDVGAFDD